VTPVMFLRKDHSS